MSLSSKLTKKAVTGDEPLAKPVLVRQKAMEISDLVTEHDEDEVILDEPEEDAEDKFKNILFISDRPLSKEIQTELSQYNNIKQFDVETFANRSLSTLLDMNVTHIWVNLKVREGRNYLKTQLMKPHKYGVIVCYHGNKNQKWIKQLESKTDYLCKLSELNKLKSLTYGELQEKISNSIDIHEPAKSLLFELLTCSSAIIKSKK